VSEARSGLLNLASVGRRRSEESENPAVFSDGLPDIRRPVDDGRNLRPQFRTITQSVQAGRRG